MLIIHVYSWINQTIHVPGLITFDLDAGTIIPSPAGT